MLTHWQVKPYSLAAVVSFFNEHSNKQEEELGIILTQKDGNEFSNTAPGNHHFKSSHGNAAWILMYSTYCIPPGVQTQHVSARTVGQTPSYMHTAHRHAELSKIL